MQELMEALRNYGSFTILGDIIKQGYKTGGASEI